MTYMLRRLVDKMFAVFRIIALSFMALGVALIGVGIAAHVTGITMGQGVTIAPSVPNIAVTQAATKHFKLYGLDCTKCYLSIVRQVKQLPGVRDVHFYRSTKTLVITGSGYSMKEVHRIVQSEKQRIVGQGT